MKNMKLTLADYIQVKQLVRDQLLFIENQSSNSTEIKFVARLRADLIKKLDYKLNELEGEPGGITKVFQ